MTPDASGGAKVESEPRRARRALPLVAGALVVALFVALALLPPSHASTGASGTSTATPRAGVFSAAALPGLLRAGLAPRPVSAPEAAQIASVSTTLPIIYADRCQASHYSNLLLPCRFNSAGSGATVMLIGDSHAAEWFPALLSASHAEHWRLISHTKAGCPPVASTIPNNPTDPNAGPYDACSAWNRALLAQMRAVHPDLVVIGILAPEVLRHLSSLSRYLDEIAPLVGHSVVLGDTPYPHFDAPSCIAANLGNAAACTLDQRNDLPPSSQARLAAAVRASRNASYLPTVQWLCLSGRCPVIVAGVVMYRDNSHLSLLGARALSGLLASALGNLVPGL